jgi:hypothetical protein
MNNQEQRTPEDKVTDSQEAVRQTSNNLVHRLADMIDAGGDVHATVQSLELFIRAVVNDEARIMLERFHG